MKLKQPHWSLKTKSTSAKGALDLLYMNSNYTKNQDLGLERQYVNSLENELLIDKRMCAKKASLNLAFIEGLKTPSPLLSRAFAYRESTGIGCLPVDSNNPMHKPLYTDPK